MKQDLLSLVLCKLGECNKKMSVNKGVSDALSILWLSFRLSVLGKPGWDWGGAEKSRDEKEIVP